MISKIVIFAAFVVFASASGIGAPLAYTAPIPVPIAAPIIKTVVSSEYDPNPQYTYGYAVNDPFTGDSKSQVESRNGDFVKGQYSLDDSDGTRRTVDYVADPLNGFNAIVSKTPIAKAIIPAPIVARAPIVAPAPIASPVISAYNAPLGALPYSGYFGYGYPYGYAGGIARYY